MQWIIWAVCKQLLLFHPSDGEVPSGLGCSSSLRSWLLGSGVLICTAAAQGAWCLFLIPLVAEERRARLLKHRVFYKLPPSRHCIKLFIPGGPGTSMRESSTAPGPAATGCLCSSFHASQGRQRCFQVPALCRLYIWVHWCYTAHVEQIWGISDCKWNTSPAYSKQEKYFGHLLKTSK